jgi:hypothetical protein
METLYDKTMSASEPKCSLIQAAKGQNIYQMFSWTGAGGERGGGGCQYKTRGSHQYKDLR